LKIGGLSYKNGITFYGDNSFVVSKINDKGIFEIDLIVKKRDFIASLTKSIPFIRYYFESTKSSIFSMFMLFIFLLCDTVNKGKISLGILVLIILLFAFIICIIQNNKFSGFHGAEHKAINSYNFYNDISIEHIRKASRIANNCGTNFLIMIVFITVITSIITFIILKKFYVITIFINYGVSRELFILNDIDKKPIISLIYKFGELLQKNILTKEPTEKQLELAKVAIETLINYEEKAISNNYTS